MNAQTETKPSQEVTIDQPKEKSLPAQLKDKQSNFHAALPAHIPAERFARVVLTAIQNNPKLADANRPSLWNACMRAAQDGLLPDGRDGALVIYNTKEDNAWVAKVQWMPMIGGIRKKVRNSGEIKDWNAQVVHAKDQFEFELGDTPFIKHKPYMDGEPGPVIAAYSIAQFKSGELSREVMTRSQIEKVRSVSRSKDKGPWVDWYEEMCRKTVARRHSKSLPMSSDLDDLIRRDDELYDMEGKSDKQLSPPLKALGDRLGALAGITNGDPEPELIENGGLAEDNPSPSPHTDLREEAAADASPVERRAGASTNDPDGDPAPVPQHEPAGSPVPAEAASELDRQSVGRASQEPLEGVAASLPPGAAAPSQYLHEPAGPSNGSTEARPQGNTAPGGAAVAGARVNAPTVAAAPSGRQSTSGDPELDARERRAEIRRDGAARAAAGTAALTDFLEGLRKAGEADLVSTILRDQWREVAKAVDAKAGRK